MKIVHLTHTDLRYDNRILKEVEAIASNQEYDITCIGVLLNENAAYSDRNVRAKLVNLDLFSSKLKFLPRWFSYTILLFELTFKLFRSTVKLKPQIVHCHDTMVLPAGYLIKLFYKNILIYDAHELESDKNGQSKILAYATLLIESFCWKSIDYFISVSDSIIEWYTSKFGDKPSVLILNSPIMNGGQKVQNNKQDDYFRDKYKIESSERIFVYVGLLGLGRSIPKLLKVFADDTVNSHIVFVGYGELQELVENESKRNSKIHFHEAVPHENVVEIIRSADVGLCLLERVSLSDYYALPNKLFEYSFAGLQILASDFPELQRVVEKYNLGKCTKTDFDSLFSAILSFGFQKEGKVLTNIYELSWEVQAKRLVDLYVRIVFELSNQSNRHN